MSTPEVRLYWGAQSHCWWAAIVTSAPLLSPPSYLTKSSLVEEGQSRLTGQTNRCYMQGPYCQTWQANCTLYSKPFKWILTTFLGHFLGKNNNIFNLFKLNPRLTEYPLSDPLTTHSHQKTKIDMGSLIHRDDQETPAQEPIKGQHGHAGPTFRQGLRQSMLLAALLCSSLLRLTPQRAQASTGMQPCLGPQCCTDWALGVCCSPMFLLLPLCWELELPLTCSSCFPFTRLSLSCFTSVSC